MDASIPPEEDSSHPYMHSNSYNGAEHNSRRGEGGDGDDVDAPYHDEFPLSQPVRAFSGSQLMSLSCQKGWQGHTYKHSNDYDSPNYDECKGKVGKVGDEDGVNASYHDEFCLSACPSLHKDPIEAYNRPEEREKASLHIHNPSSTPIS